MKYLNKERDLSLVSEKTYVNSEIIHFYTFPIGVPIVYKKIKQYIKISLCYEVIHTFYKGGRQLTKQQLCVINSNAGIILTVKHI